MNRSFFYFIPILALLVSPTLTRAGEPAEIEVPKKLLKKLKSFEPSAAIYLEAQESYLISSDDTTKQDEPMLFLLNKEGKVDKEPVAIEGIEKMTDMESLSLDGNYVYVMSSQSRNKKGKILGERNLFARSRLENGALVGTEVMELRSHLLRNLGQAKDRRLEAIKEKLDQQLEIEASLVRDGQVVVGLKDPQPRPGVGLLLDLGTAEEIFSGKGIDPASIKVTMELDFASAGGSTEKISDVIADQDRLLIAATIEEGGGSVWELKSGKLSRLKEYPELKPEGLAVNREGEVLVVFDQGEETAQFAHERF